VPPPELHGNDGETPSEEPTRCGRYFRRGRTNRSTTRIRPRLKATSGCRTELSIPGCNRLRVGILFCKGNSLRVGRLHTAMATTARQGVKETTLKARQNRPVSQKGAARLLKRIDLRTFLLADEVEPYVLRLVPRCVVSWSNRNSLIAAR